MLFHKHTRAGRRTSAYVLFEVILAMAVFALVVVGMVVSLQRAIDTTNDFKKESAIRKGLESILIEAKHRPRKEMALTYKDERLGVDYRTEVRELKLTNIDGAPLHQLWTLRATATYDNNGTEETYSAEVYVQRP